MKRVSACVTVVMAAWALAANAADWPQYKGDAARSGVSSENLQFPLELNWAYRFPQPMSPAWEEPGREFHRIDFDHSPQPVIAQDRVFVCSSSDDTLRALDAKSGRVLWRFTAGGPLRFAPAVADGRVFLASDDGWLYALQADTGALAWKFQAAPDDAMLLGNERMISRWPLRSGALVADGVLYTVAGMWPAEGIYVYALNPETGEVIWRNDASGAQYVELPHPGATGFSGVAPQGYLALCGDILLVPTGRAIPGAFDRRTGEFLYCWTHRNWNDAKRGGCWLSATQDLYFNPTREPRGTSECYVGEAGPLPGDGMVAYKPETGDPLFELKGKHRVIAAGDVLYAVGNGEAAAYDLAALRSGKSPGEARKWTTPHPRAYSLALAGDTLFIGGKGVLKALDATSGAQKWYRTLDIPGPIRGISIANGRVVVGTDEGIVACFSAVRSNAGVSEDSPDWRFNLPAEALATADSLLQRSEKQTGYALVAGAPDPTLAAALAMRSSLHIIHAAHGGSATAEARDALMHTGFNGSRAAAIDAPRPDKLPLPPYFADLIIVTGDASALNGAELYRVLRPCGGALLFDDGLPPEVVEHLLTQTGAPESEIQAQAPGHPILRRGPLPGAGEWRHQWADGGRTGIGKETRLQMPLELLWFGGPGPNRMMDRHFGSSPPLSVNGRVFITGEHHLIAFDAYNGRELWSALLRGLGRRGAMWNAANFVADDDMVYAAVGSACYCVDQASGAVIAAHAIPGEVAAAPAAWQYIDVGGDLLLGMCRFEGCNLFALDKRDGSLRWKWKSARNIPASGIAFDAGRIYCLDLEYPDDQARRRGEMKIPQRSLVALSLEDGHELWRTDNIPRTPQDHVQVADGIVVVYANVAYDAATGKLLWQKRVEPERPPLIQGEWIIAQPHAYNLRTGEQRMETDGTTGESKPWEYIQSYGCGGVNGVETMLFFRSAVLGFYDFASDATTTFGGVRPGCSINIVGANGLAIVPETSSGCACTYNFQTCLALAPSADRAREPWFVIAGRQSLDPARQLNLNLGAPGDRRGPDGRAWLAVPRPILSGAAPTATYAASKDARFYCAPREDALNGLEQPWLYGSGVRNPGTITVDLVSQEPVEALPCTQPIEIDGRMDPWLLESGQAKRSLGFSNGLPRKAELFVRQDDANLYIIIRSIATTPESTPATWAAVTQGQDARVWEDDSWEVYLTDRNQQQCLHLGVSASGARFDGLWDYAVYEKVRGLDRAWNGSWKSAAGAEGNEMTIEMAIPFDTLASIGFDCNALEFNVLGTGPGNLGSPDILGVSPSGYCARWTGLIEAPAPGDYALTLKTNGHALLKVDGEVVAQHDRGRIVAESSANVTFAAGQRRTIEVVYEDGALDAGAHLLWTPPGGEKTIVPTSALFTAAGDPGGLSATFSNRWYESPVLERIDPVVDFDWTEVDIRKVPKAELRSHGAERPQYARAFVPLTLAPPKVESTYTVRLHFAEPTNTEPGLRVFDVKIQDAPVLEQFDIVREAGGINKALVREFKGIVPDENARIAIALTAPTADPANAASVPIISAVEVSAE